MSALGQKQTFAARTACRFTPESEHVRCSCGCPLWAISGHDGRSLFNQLVCELLEMKRYLQPQRFGRLKVDNKLILRRRLYRHVGWLFALQDTVNVAGGAAIQVGSIRAIR